MNELGPLIVYVVAAFGLAYIVGHSKISLPVREWIARTKLAWFLELIECPACLGFWIGLVASFFLGTNWFVWALFTSGSNFLLGKFSGLIVEAKDE